MIAAVPKESGEAVKQGKIVTMHYMYNWCSRKQQKRFLQGKKFVSLYRTSILIPSN